MNLRRVANQYSYVLVAVLALLVGAFYVAREPRIARWIAWLIAAALLYVLYFVLRPGKPTVTDTAQLEAQVARGQPLLLELYSTFCLGSMIVKPVVDGIEQEPGVAARLLRIDVTTPGGQDIARELEVDVTPTFIAVDSQGQEQWRLVGGATNRLDLVKRLRRLT
ncbi:MAG: thioredoxin family protein [Chloroflexota bacterium]|nr:thioredoxin family protein [Chloroflexota bacterium]